MPTHWLEVPLTAPYRWTMLAAMALSASFWLAKTRRDPALLCVYVGALGGAFVGAKLAYLFAEGWMDWPLPDRWMRLAAGRSIVGGLLGGYAGVEWMKRLAGYGKPTGDIFALIVPPGIALGRVGCWLQGCCLGRPMTLHFIAARDKLGVLRWPASQVELLFQLVMLAVLLWLHRTRRFESRLFFLYLLCYGLFRFFHEFVRDTPTMMAGLSGYQLLALVMAALGGSMFARRAPARAR